jgi:hypothetical protein
MVAMFIISTIVLSIPLLTTQAQEPELRPVSLFLHGNPEIAVLNSSRGDYEEVPVLTTGPTDVPTVAILLGEWTTEPLTYPMSIGGQVGFLLEAIGELQQVRFIAYLTVDGVEVSEEMVTPYQDLNESQALPFQSNVVNLTAPIVEVNSTQTVGLRISLEHNDLQWYQSIPPPGQGKNVTLVFGGLYGSFVGFSANSLQVQDIEGEDDPASGNMLVTAKIKCSFGVEDFFYAIASTKTEYGNRFTKKSEIAIDNATMEVKWEWDYSGSVTEGGSYPVTVKVYDRGGNRWELTEDVHITTLHTEVDFGIKEADISFSENPQKDKNTTITASITGSGRRWNTYNVKIEFYDGSELIESVTSSVKRSGSNKVEVVWIPDTDGKHIITVEVDTDNTFSETREDNNEASKTVTVQSGLDDNGAPGFGGLMTFLTLVTALSCTILYRRLWGG